MQRDICSLLREHGYKVTPQRLAIYEVLANTKAHPSAEMIFQQLQPTHPTMSLATVYKTIDMLKNVGVVQELNVGEDSFRYDANVEFHPHIVCLSCRRVDDVEVLECGDLARQIWEQTRYQLVRQQFFFYGFCPQCQRTRASTS